MTFRRLVIVVMAGLLLPGCSRLPWHDPRPPENAVRFVLMNVQRTLPDGSSVPMVLRMNVATGESFTLSGNPPRWESLADEVQVRYTINPRTNKLERSERLPDGADLSSLSKEDLIRRLNAAVRACAPAPATDPTDPLGIRK
jgi:hypothetical protein